MADLVPGRRLLPYEHGLAVLVLRRNAERRTPAVLRHEQNLGRHGIMVAAAGLTNLLLAELLALSAILVLTFAAGRPAVPAAATGLLVLAGAAAGLTILRLRQAAAIGRQFRGDRPPARR